MRRWISVLVPSAAALVALAGCASPDSTEAADRETTPRTVTATSPQHSASADNTSPRGSGASSTGAHPAPSGTEPASPDNETADTNAAAAHSGAGMMGAPSLEDNNQLSQASGELVPVGVRTAQHDGFSRLVIEFAGSGEPGWFAGYTDAPTHQASGQPVEVGGNAYLTLGIEPTPWPSTAEAREAQLAPGNFPGAGVIEDVAFTGGFEAQSQFVVGVKEQVPYSVTYLDGPPRVVVDFAG